MHPGTPACGEEQVSGGRVRQAGAVIAGGLHPDIRAKSFRVGHMNAVNASDCLATVGALERALHAGGHALELGAGVAAAQRSLGQQ